MKKIYYDIVCLVDIKIFKIIIITTHEIYIYGSKWSNVINMQIFLNRNSVYAKIWEYILMNFQHASQIMLATKGNIVSGQNNNH